MSDEDEFFFIKPKEYQGEQKPAQTTVDAKPNEGKDNFVFIGGKQDTAENTADPFYVADQVSQSGFESTGRVGEEKLPSWAAPAGAALGAAAAYKGGVSPNVFKPHPGVFGPRAAPTPQITPSMSALTMEINRLVGDIQMFGQTPERMAYLDHLMQVKEGAAPRSDVEHMIQSGRGEGQLTGRQMEMAHNMESQRQKLAFDENVKQPGAAKAVVEAGPMIVSEAGVPYPKRAAVEIENEKKAAAETERQQRVMQQARERVQGEQTSVAEAIRQQQLQADQQRQAVNRGRVTGASKVGMGAAAGALGGLQAAQMATQKPPIDWTQWTSLLGNLGAMMRQTPGMALAGGLAQLPYAIKHREEIMRGLNLGDINPSIATGSELYRPVENALPGKP